MKTSIAVVGGCYFEECSFPRFRVHRGSGFRGSIQLRSLGTSVSLHTVLGPSFERDFVDLADRYGINLHYEKVSSDIWFRYRHPLAAPDIFPRNIANASFENTIRHDCVLVYGMLEGRPPIVAQRAVYDPQDGSSSKAFSFNGSTAGELAIIASESEGAAMTGESSPDLIAQSLLGPDNCTVAVIKCAAKGALVATNSKRKWIRPFPSSRVCKIGSGDIFSAGFAQRWLFEGASPIEAATFASRLTSEFVETGREVVSSERLTEVRHEADLMTCRASDIPPGSAAGRIYLAGPFFTASEQWLIDEARSALEEMGLRVFSPVHEIGIGPAEIVAPADLYELQCSDLVFAVLNGMDAGTIFELGYARALGIPVVALAERADEGSLTMLKGSGCAVFNDFATAVYIASWQLMGNV